MPWTYPQDELLAIHRREAAAPIAQDLAIEALNLDYRIEGDRPPWRPVRALDDGRQLLIEFPVAMEVGEAPRLFGVGPSGRAELVNYRKRGRYYVVDRLLSVAELRLGTKRQQVVRIIRNGVRTSRRGRAS